MPHPATNSGFLDGINISLDPPVTIHDPDLDHASLNFKETSHQEVLTSYNPGLAMPRNTRSRWRTGNSTTNSRLGRLCLEAEFETSVSKSARQGGPLGISLKF